LRDWGFIAVIATGFGDIFRRNALRNGLLAIELPESFVSDLSDDVDADPTTAITIRLDATSVSTSERTHSFELDSRVRWLLLNGFDEIDATLRSTQDIDRHEQSRPAWLPRVRLTSMAGDAP
jgi:3-isopropylmalate/(R)-2-methylmalate dehydratase small subunit